MLENVVIFTAIAVVVIAAAIMVVARCARPKCHNCGAIIKGEICSCGVPKAVVRPTCEKFAK